MTEVHGDEEAADVAEGFANADQRILPGYGAGEVKRIGDAVMFRAEEASRAVALALRIASGVGEQHGSPAVRVGIHTGTVIERGDDWLVATVNVAARVAGAAAGGQALLTEPTREAAGRLDSIELLPRGRRKLRNVSQPVQLYEAVARGETTADGLNVDPVCRMAVDPIHSAGSLRHRGAVFSSVHSNAPTPSPAILAASPVARGGRALVDGSDDRNRGGRSRSGGHRRAPAGRPCTNRPPRKRAWRG